MVGFILGGLLAIGLLFGLLYFLLSLTSPAKALNASFSKLLTQQSLKYDAKLTVSMKSESSVSDPKPATPAPRSRGRSTLIPTAQAAESKPGDPYHFEFSATGAVDFADQTKPKGYATLKASTNSPEFKSASVTVEARSLDEVIYFQLIEASQLEEIELTGLEKKWIKVDYTEANQDLSAEADRDAFPKLTDDQTKQLSKEARKAKLLIIKRDKDEDIDGVATRHYTYNIDKERLRTFIPTANQIIYGKAMSDDERKELDESFKEFEFMPGEVWVGKEDKLPHKLTFGIVPKGETSISSLTFEMAAKDYGQPVTVEAPKDTITLEEFFGGAGSSGGASSSDSSQDSKRKSDLSQYKVALLQYASDHNGRYPTTTTAAAMTKTGAPYAVLGPDYLQTFLDDPKAPNAHYYYASDGKRFGVCADLPGQPGQRYQVGPTASATVAGSAKSCPLLN